MLKSRVGQEAYQEYRREEHKQCCERYMPARKLHTPVGRIIQDLIVIHRQNWRFRLWRKFLNINTIMLNTTKISWQKHHLDSVLLWFKSSPKTKSWDSIDEQQMQMICFSYLHGSEPFRTIHSINSTTTFLQVAIPWKEKLD